jgi:pilus assembly protein CpaB
LSRRIIGLVLALVLAGVATFFLITWVQGARDEVVEETTFVEVFTAAGTIEAGTPADIAINRGLIQRSQLPQESVPEGAVGQLDAIRGQLAVSTIFQGEVIIASRFGDVAQTETGLQEIPEDRQAVTVEAGVVPGLAGFVRPGDRLSVVASLEVPEDAVAVDEEGNQTTATTAGIRTQYVVQDAIVLAVGQRVVTFDENGTKTGYRIAETNDRYIFTLAVVPQDIERLLFASQQGTVWFTLLPEGQEPVNTPGRTIEDIFS